MGSMLSTTSRRNWRRSRTRNPQPPVSQSGPTSNVNLAIWTKPAATTKQKKMHRVPLSRAAVSFLRTRIGGLPEGSGCLFPDDVEGQPIEDIRRFWADVQKKAGISGVRIHDLRDTFASLLVSGGASLPIVGKLLAIPKPRPRSVTLTCPMIPFGRVWTQ